LNCHPERSEGPYCYKQSFSQEENLKAA